MVMSTWTPPTIAAVATLVAWSALAPFADADALDDAEKALNARFKGKQATAKIDLPWRRSLYVAPDGSHDEQRYYERIRASEKILRAGEKLKIHHLEIDDDHINVCIGGPQCGQAWKPKSSKTVVVFGGPGYRIEIEFGRKMTAADAAPEIVLRALSRVLAIEGEAPPSEFSVTSVLPSPPAAAAPVAGSTAQAPSAPSAARPAPSPTLALLSAEVQPTNASPGAKLKLIAQFEVAAGTLPVTEERQLLFDGRALLSNPATSTRDWPIGRHVTEVEFTLPATAAPGVYTFRLSLRGGGAEQSKEVLFVVK